MVLEIGDSIKMRLLQWDKSWFIIWIVSSVVVAAIGFQVAFWDEQRLPNEFGVLANAMSVISFSFIVGLPIFLAAAIVFGTSQSRRAIHDMLQSGINPHRVYLLQLAKSYLLVSVYMICIAITVFLVRLLNGTTFREPLEISYFVYLPAVMIASVIVGCVVVTIGACLVIITDDALLSTLMSCISTIWTATFLGQEVQYFQYVLTRGIAVFSPHNLIKALAALLSGYTPQEDMDYVDYFGFDVSITMSLTLLLILGSIAVFCTAVGIVLLQRNAKHWLIISEKTGTDEIWMPKLEKPVAEHKTEIRRELTMRRIGLVIVIVFLLTGVLIGAQSYKDTVIEESTITFYQSPDGGERFEIGVWYVFSCVIQPSQYGEREYLHWDLHLELWNSLPENLTFFYGHESITTEEFYQLNETERQACLRNTTTDDWYGSSGSLYVGDDYGAHIYAFKMLDVDNTTNSDYFFATFHLYQGPY